MYNPLQPLNEIDWEMGCVFLGVFLGTWLVTNLLVAIIVIFVFSKLTGPK